MNEKKNIYITTMKCNSKLKATPIRETSLIKLFMWNFFPQQINEKIILITVPCSLHLL